MTQQNAALVEESTAAAASMRDQAQKLAEVVSMFNVGAVAARAPGAAPRPAPAASRPVAAPARKGVAGKSPAPATARLTASVPKPAAAGPAPAPAPRATAKGGDDDWESF